MKLKDLLKIHDSESSQLSLADNLGDGYLIDANLIYRSIREAAVRADFKFSNKRFYDYDTLSLTQLPKILEARIIPYRNNVNPIRAIEKKAPGKFSLSEIPPLNSNHLFHESAHAIAHDLIAKTLGNKARVALTSEARLVLHTFLEEAFANATECLANIYSTNDVHDEFLFKNSYIMEDVPIRKTVRLAVEAWGVENTFKVLFFSFLHANYLQIKDTHRSLERVANLIFRETPKKTALLKRVFRIGLDLDPEFTIFTNSFCLKLAGVKNLEKSLAHANFLSAFEKNSAYRLLLNQLVEVLTA